MRALTAALIALLFATVASAADLTFVRVWPGYRTAESFERIGEYLGQKESAPGQTLLRTQPASREGYYFLTRLKNGGAEIAGARIELNVITPFAKESKTYSFSCTVPAGSHVLNLGLTGSDWPANEEKAEAVAWQIRILSSDGQELIREESFLWAKPAK